MVSIGISRWPLTEPVTGNRTGFQSGVIQNRFHPKPVSLKTGFVQTGFIPNRIFIRNRFRIKFENGFETSLKSVLDVWRGSFSKLDVWRGSFFFFSKSELDTVAELEALLEARECFRAMRIFLTPLHISEQKKRLRRRGGD